MSTVNLVSSLIDHGKSLAKQLDKAKTIPKPVKNNIYDEVEKIVTGLIQDLGELDDEEYTTKECFDKVVRKTISSLEELKKHDDPQYASGYEDLVTNVGKFRLSIDVSPTVTTRTHTLNKTNDENDCDDNNNYVQNSDFNLDSYMKLNHAQKSLLDLFAMLRRGTKIKKNDLLLWWFAPSTLNETMYLTATKDSRESGFEKDLKELVEMKLIEPVVAEAETSVSKNNKRERIKYKMWNAIWSKFQYSEQNDDGFVHIRIKKINSLSISTYTGYVVNSDACNLTIERINMLTKTHRWMLQLGNWNHDPTKYTVVEDDESLNKVWNLKPPMFLSLEGVFGLVTLPCFDGRYLAVLNLKGCHSLESLPQLYRMRMRKLEYLDMSECYLLDETTNVIGGCVWLKVVKGFVVPRQQLQPHSYSFISNPSQFKYLWKLTLRTRRLNFPTNSDLETLCELKSLTHLKITWVGACLGGDNQQVQFDDSSKFPPNLAKFEMEAASDSTSTKILDLIAQQQKVYSNSLIPDLLSLIDNTAIQLPLKKLYVKGGNLSKLNPEVDCKILRLHYLPKMEFDCYDMMRSFPKLHRLEMSKDVMYSMLRRSFQKATGTNDQNSGWEPSLNPPSPPSAS